MTVGNVFEIAAPDKAFDLCLVHDLFEHLSLEGMQAAVKEVCRVTRQGLCIGFFNMDEIRDHQRAPGGGVSLEPAEHGAHEGVVCQHAVSPRRWCISAPFCGSRFGCEQTHNPNAYTFLARPGP